MKKTDRRIIVVAFAKEYRKSTKKKKSALLTQLEKTTGYSRKHLMAFIAYPPKSKRIRRKRASRYISVIVPLRKLWKISNYACGQRFVPIIPVYLDALKRHTGFTVSEQETVLMQKISSATFDRLFQKEKQKLSGKARSRTKPGTLLKHKIPIRTYADWNDVVPGFLEIDLVHHCDEIPKGEYIHTLDSTDVATGWNECVAFMGRGERNTVTGMESIQQRLPFTLKGVDFDTGAEFVNYHFIRWCKRHKITYTRAREEKKNDQNYVEQQNFSVVRRFVGYDRLDSQEQLKILNQLYAKLSDYQNFFQPVMKLKEKVRNGTRLTRRYSKAQTAYQRVLEQKSIPGKTKILLRQRFLNLNPEQLLDDIISLAEKLANH